MQYKTIAEVQLFLDQILLQRLLENSKKIHNGACGMICKSRHYYEYDQN